MLEYFTVTFLPSLTFDRVSSNIREFLTRHEFLVDSYSLTREQLVSLANFNAGF